MYIGVSCGLVTAVHDGPLDGAVCTDWSPSGSLMDERNVYRYKYTDGEVIERTAEEMDADYAAMPKRQPSDTERIAQLEEELKAAKILLGVE